LRNPNPISPRKQLSAYYKAQGFTGQRARKAVRDDMRRVRELFREQNASCILDRGEAEAWEIASQSGIAGIFVFCITREGIDYWAPRAYALGGL